MTLRFSAVPALVVLASCLSLSANAGPRIVTDISPIQSLAAQVAKGVATPDSIIPASVSPHHYSMRPSEAAKLADADIVFWIGEDYSPGFTKAISSIARNTLSVPLMESPGLKLLDYDDDHETYSDKEDHGDHKDEERHEAHAEKEVHGDHEDEEHHEEHAEKEGHHEHDHHEGKDPHIWLDPVNAKVIIAQIAANLSKIDPDNSRIYTANAASAMSELDALADRVSAILAPVRDRAFVTAHDAYSYFEERFDLRSSGAVSFSDASAPGPSHIADLRRSVRTHEISCIFIEPQLNPRLVQTVAEGTTAKIGVIDPLGTELAPGPALYPALIENMARSMAKCLGSSN